MRKRIQKAISLMLCAAVLFAYTGVKVSAKESVQRVIYNEITDINQLISLGLQQKAQAPAARAEGGILTEEDTVLYAKQMLSRTDYADGTVEETYVNSGIMIMDETGKPLLTGSFDSAMNKNGWNSYNGVIVTVNMYYTVRTDAGNLSILFRFDKMVTTIKNENNSSTPPIRGENRYMHESYGIYGNQTFYLQPTTVIQSSTLNSGHSQFCESAHGYYCWKAIAYIYLSNGQEIAVQVAVNTSA